MQNNNYTGEMFADYPDVVDVSGLQSMLGNIGRQTAYELVRKGTIKAIKVIPCFCFIIFFIVFCLLNI